MTQVVNCKVKYIRPRYNNLEEWMNDPNHVYIGRRGVVFIKGVRYPKQDSIWANPFKIKGNDNRETVIQKYREYITDALKSGRISVEDLHKLDGKILGCWCKESDSNIDVPCHGDVLLELLQIYK